MRRRVQHDEVSAIAWAEGTEVVAPKCPCATGRGGHERLVRGQVHLAHGEGYDKGHARGVARARVAVSRDGDAHPGI